MHHKLLNRQLRRAKKKGVNNELDVDALLSMVNDSYEHADNERRKVENSLNLMSREMLDLNVQVQDEASAAIATANKRFELAVSGTMDGIWDWDIKTGEIFYSPIWFKLLGHKDKALPYTKATWLTHIHKEDVQNVTEMINAFIAGDKEKNRVQYRMTKKNGEEVWVESKWTGAYCQDGSLHRMVGTVVNVSQQKQTELVLKNAKEDAEKTAQLKSDFLASMSHEIRTPMNGVIGVLSLLEETTLDEYQTSLCETIHSSGMLLLNIINDILDFSKIEAGKLHTEILGCSPQEICQTVERGLYAQADEKGIKISYTVAEDVPKTIHTDPTRVQQILFNLWGNGIKFTKQGSVHVSVTIDTTDSELIHFAIKDTGIGIKADKIPTLFQMFNQADNSIARNFGGTGLGLSISKKLVEMLGGHVAIESILGEGSTFSFSLRNYPETDVKHAKDSPVLEEDDHLIETTELNILVAEDNKVNQFLIRKILENAGHTVTIAENGQEAIDLLQAHQDYNIILMDIHMPDVDGIEATTQIRHLGGRLSKIPIIALTANVMDSDRHNYMKIGMNDYLSKPIEKDVFFKVIHKWGRSFKQ